MNPHQQVLQITKPMWIVITVVMGVGLLGKLDEPEPSVPSNKLRQSSYISQDLTVTRLSNEPVEFPELGLLVAPVDDWSCLTVVDQQTPFRHTFVNEKSLLIARITRFPFTSWPPKPRADSGDSSPSNSPTANTEPKQAQPQPASARQANVNVQVNSDQYEHVSIDWIRLPNSPTKGALKLLGRIETDSFDALLTVIDFRQDPQHSTEIKNFCNHIRMLE